MSTRNLLPALATAACTVVLTAASPAAAALEPAQLTLRLPDLGPGYSGNTCDRWPQAGEFRPRTLQRLAARFGRRGCRIRFDQAWRKHDPTRPEGIESDAFVFDAPTGPQAAMRQAQAMVALAIGADPGGELKAVAATNKVGDETRAFRTDTYEGRGFALMWRSASVLALVHATGSPSDLMEKAAYRLAAAQQARIVSPSPLRPADLDDLEVPLDDPSLRLPVYWLGRTLPAHDGRFPLTLYLADGQGPSRSRTEPGATLQYGHEGWVSDGQGRTRAEIIDVNLDLWAPSADRRILHDELRRSCVHRYDSRLDGIDATIVGPYRSPRRRCGQGPPARWMAIVRFRGVIARIDPNVCTLCRRRSATYASRAGLRALVQALRPRVPRAFPPAGAP